MAAPEADAGGEREFSRSIGDRLDASPLVAMLDIDGTLAPIAPTPDAARVPEATRAAVTRLAGLPGVTVALVSGRSAADAWRLAGVPGAFVIGNHGFETRSPAGDIAADRRVQGYDEAIAIAAERLSAELAAVAGAIVENKRWTLSVHYRQVAPHQLDQLVQRSHDTARDLGLRVLPGKKIVELRPPLDIDKGTACALLLERLQVTGNRGAALYAGDDQTDEDAFRVVRERSRGAVTVRIASAEDAAGRHTSAELVLESTERFRDLLGWIVARRESAGAVPG
jgi:trehalose-phosphatase